MSFRKLASDVAVYGLSSIVGRLLNYLLTPLYVRVFLPGEYGVMVELYAYIAFINVFYSWGMETAFFHFSARTRDPQRVLSAAVTWVGLLAGVGGLLLWLGAPAIAEALGYPARTALIRLAALITFFDALAILPFAWLRRRRQSIRFSIIRLGGILTAVVLNVFFLYLLPRMGYADRLPWPGRVELVFLANALASGVVVVWLLPLLLRHYRHADGTLMRRLIGYGWPLMVAGLAAMINETADRPLLKWLLPGSLNERMTAVGIYGANYKLAILMILFLQAFRYAAEPYFLQQAHEAEGRRAFGRLLLLYVGTMTLVFTGLTVNIHWVKFFIGPAHSPYHSGLGIVPIVMLAFIFLGIYYNLSVWYKHTEQTHAGMWMGLAGAVVTLAANGWLIPRVGIYGAAWATLLSYGSMMLLSAWWGRKAFPVAYPWGRIAAVLGAGLAWVGVLWVLERDAFWHFELSTVWWHNLWWLLFAAGTAYVFLRRWRVLDGRS